MVKQTKIGLGGGCHWCTEAVFQSLKGVNKVDQGYIASVGEHRSFSEAVIVTFDEQKISLESLIEIHLNTHRSTSNHSMREKYRSAIYTFSHEQPDEANLILNKLQTHFNENIVTKVYAFSKFKASRDDIQNYYIKHHDKPFCERFVSPKLQLLLDKFTTKVNKNYIMSKEFMTH